MRCPPPGRSRRSPAWKYDFVSEQHGDPRFFDRNERTFDGLRKPGCRSNERDPEDSGDHSLADVVGYSRLAGADEDRILARLRALRSDLIDPTIAVHNGRVVKRTGDGSSRRISQRGRRGARVRSRAIVLSIPQVEAFVSPRRFGGARWIRTTSMDFRTTHAAGSQHPIVDKSGSALWPLRQPK